MKRNIPLKFRGVDIDTGDFVYAELGQISEETRPDYVTFLIDGLPVVRTDSIAQLLGYDEDGNEVYEGDTSSDCSAIAQTSN